VQVEETVMPKYWTVLFFGITSRFIMSLDCVKSVLCFCALGKVKRMGWLLVGLIFLYSPMVGPFLDAVKPFLDDARGFLGASLGAPDGRVVREHSRLGPLDSGNGKISAVYNVK
jgi:hypothetical protein